MIAVLLSFQHRTRLPPYVDITVTDDGALTKEDLEKLDKDPRIDPNNENHANPKQRYDPHLRKEYDDAYARLFG